MKKHWAPHPLLINEDPNWIYPRQSGVVVTTREAAIASLQKSFRRYLNKSITDVLLCILEQTSIVPSDFITWRGEKYLWTEENGHPVDYKAPEAGAGFHKIESLYKLYREFEIEPVELFIRTMREGGVRPWLTLRMNDTHHHDKEPHIIHPAFYYTARKNGWMVGSHGEDYGYFNGCLDYAQPAVREMMLNYIRDIANRYDMDGLELDFQREIFCFDYKNTPGCHEIMNDFMRKVRAIINEASEKRGRKLLLMVRLHSAIEENMAFGFDVKTWAEEKLIDAVVPSPRWEYSNSSIPVAEWKSLMGEDIAVFPGMETLNRNFTLTTIEQVKAYNAGWLSAGADGIYGYNMFTEAQARDRFVWQLTPEQCFTGRRDFLVTGQDIDSGLVPSRNALPIALSGDTALPLTVGKINATDALTLTIDFEGGAYPAVTINGIGAESVSPCPPVATPAEVPGTPDKVMTFHQALVYTFSGVEAEKELEIRFAGNGTVHYVDLVIETMS